VAPRGGVRHFLTAVWGAVTGAAPHVLHHVGPLAGAALLAGVGGQLVFLGLGVAATIPTLRRLRRRFGTWVAPGVALGLFAATFALSTFVVGPWITGAEDPPSAVTSADDHESHGH
jgi:hypothetical protein